MTTEPMPTLPTAEEQIWTLHTAARFAGSFYKALANAGLLADPQNRARLFKAWPELTASYGPGTSFYEAARSAS